MGKKITTDFATAFKEAGGLDITTFANLVRFSALIAVIIAIMWTINHFLSAELREREGFLERLASRSLRLVLAFSLSSPY